MAQFNTCGACKTAVEAVIIAIGGAAIIATLPGDAAAIAAIAAVLGVAVEVAKKWIEKAVDDGVRTVEALAEALCKELGAC